MAEGIQLAAMNTRFYCYRCDHEISLLSPTELTCPECSTGFIEEVPPDDYEEESDEDEDLSMFNLLSVENLLHRTVVNLGEVDSPRHSDPEPYDEADSPEDTMGEIYNARRFMEHLEDTFLQGPSTRLRNLGDYLFGDDIDALSTLLFNESDIPGHPPLPASQIKLLPVITISKGQVDTGVQCTICMEDFTVREKAKNLPCDHFYHEKCITPWLERHATCPNCRKPVEVVERQSKTNSRRSHSCPRYRSLSSESLNSGSRTLRFAEERPSLGTIFTTSVNPFRFL